MRAGNGSGGRCRRIRRAAILPRSSPRFGIPFSPGTSAGWISNSRTPAPSARASPSSAIASGAERPGNGPAPCPVTCPGGRAVRPARSAGAEARPRPVLRDGRRPEGRPTRGGPAPVGSRVLVHGTRPPRPSAMRSGCPRARSRATGDAGAYGVDRRPPAVGTGPAGRGEGARPRCRPAVATRTVSREPAGPGAVPCRCLPRAPSRVPGPPTARGPSWNTARRYEASEWYRGPAKAVPAA